jgi:hypothetical protein
MTVDNESGSDSTSLTVDVSSCWSPPPLVQVGNCHGGPVTLTATQGSDWLWSTGATTPTISATGNGDYWVDIDDGSGCWGHARTSLDLDNCGSPVGDANLDGLTDAADLGALVVELTDGDGDRVIDAGGGDLTAPGGDTTADWYLRPDDLLTVLFEIFRPAGAR